MAKNAKKNDNDIAKMSFEQTIKELTSIVSGIEQGETPLQESLEQYERGMKLIKHCRDILQQAEKRIEEIGSSDKQMSAEELAELDDIPDIADEPGDEHEELF